MLLRVFFLYEFLLLNANEKYAMASTLGEKS